LSSAQRQERTAAQRRTVFKETAVDYVSLPMSRPESEATWLLALDRRHHALTETGSRQPPLAADTVGDQPPSGSKTTFCRKRSCGARKLLI